MATVFSEKSLHTVLDVRNGLKHLQRALAAHAVKDPAWNTLRADGAQDR